MVEIINSIEDLCRLCAGKIDVLMGLNIFASDHRQIFKKICVCLPIQISVDDSLPKMVCVECACKLDLMFDFRERSILTAHLFTDMITVNNGGVINVSQSLPITNDGVTGEPDFNSDFMSCKLDVVKYNNDLTSQVCSASNESILNQDGIDLDETRDLMSKTKLKPKTRMSKKCSNDLDSKIVEQITQLQSSDDNLIKKLCQVESPKLFHHSQEPNLSSNLNNKNLSPVKLEVDSIINHSSQNLNDCSGIEWFFCSVCSKTFEGKEAYELHSQEHLQTVKFEEVVEVEDDEEEVDEGVEREGAKTNLNKKKKAKQKKTGKVKNGEKKNESRVCLECGKQYQTNYKLQEHMRKHTGEKPFLCSYQDCKKAFRSKIGLAQHEASHSGQFEFSCSTCGKGFQCKSYLVVHQRVHSDLKPFACKQCTRRFKTKQSLLDHMNRHLGVKPYLCDICGRGFITKGLCKSHQKVHSGTDNRQYPCQVCRKLFVSKSYLNTHFRIHTGEKPFICEVCGKGFLTRVDLRIHSTMHTGEKSFICEMCGKAFARRDALRCHRRSHTGERPYKCEFCGQSFTQFSPMAIHKRLHTGERPYECDVCNKTFVSRSTMIAHKKKHHSPKKEDGTPSPPINTPPAPAAAATTTTSTTGSNTHVSIPNSQFQFVSVEVQQEELNGHEEPSTEQLVVIENSPQLLLALSKRHSVVTESAPEILSLHKVKSEGSDVPVE